jgi:hypothetical protein
MDQLSYIRLLTRAAPFAVAAAMRAVSFDKKVCPTGIFSQLPGTEFTSVFI